jgi:hypothetical protein
MPENPNGYTTISGFPQYCINKKGDVYSHRSKRLLTPFLVLGYLRVDLRNPAHNYRQIHRLLAETFISNKHKNKNVRHLDDNKLNNTLNNLAWGSDSDNVQDCIRNGHFPFGEKHGRAVLNTSKVKLARLLHSEFGWSIDRIAKLFKTANSTIQMVLTFKTWKNAD